MSADIGLPISAQQRFPRVGSRRWWSSGLLVVGGAATLLGTILPWGHGITLAVTGLTRGMAPFTLALGVVGVVAVVCGGFALTHSRVTPTATAGALGSAILGIAAALILPAGISVAADYLPGFPDPTLEVGVWLLAAGVTAVVTGAMLANTRRRITTLVALALPFFFALIMLCMLMDVTI